ncbi:MAG: hypothetical protein PHN80_15350 [Hespellia sp.]|uniref:Uncharacterized protein n=1 Tax=Hespellia stercorisuis DSM 15480 TaxID=1121950 RepID=A0A1M6S562_9FIRM|nr:hypothetical protein [Hespellia stercorisuis]MDD2981328.1 hypothetical protein [Hespellia sp.]SHK39873.1 hypothetical protein SAMN02745243_02859 [Hespellia stercorisuis DSM 15480]
MLEMFQNLMSSRTFFITGAQLGVVVTVIFIIMIVRKRNRDERGWKIFGKASIAAFIWLILIINVIAKITGNASYPHEQIGYHQFANTLQWVYDTTILVEIVAVFIIRHRE